MHHSKRLPWIRMEERCCCICCVPGQWLTSIQKQWNYLNREMEIPQGLYSKLFCRMLWHVEFFNAKKCVSALHCTYMYLHYVTPHHTLHHTTLHHTKHHATPHYATLHYTTRLHCTTPNTTPHHSTLHYTTLHGYTAPHQTPRHTTLHYATLHHSI